MEVCRNTSYNRVPSPPTAGSHSTRIRQSPRGTTEIEEGLDKPAPLGGYTGFTNRVALGVELNF